MTDLKTQAQELHDQIVKWTQNPDRDEVPCPFSAEALEAAFQKVRDDALDEAARVALEFRAPQGAQPKPIQWQVEDAIRALKAGKGEGK